jgi:hypothetical protein
MGSRCHQFSGVLLVARIASARNCAGAFSIGRLHGGPAKHLYERLVEMVRAERNHG